MCHPPVGLNLYVASGIAKMGITELTVAVLAVAAHDARLPRARHLLAAAFAVAAAPAGNAVELTGGRAAGSFCVNGDGVPPITAQGIVWSRWADNPTAQQGGGTPSAAAAGRLFYCPVKSKETPWAFRSWISDRHRARRRANRNPRAK